MFQVQYYSKFNDAWKPYDSRKFSTESEAKSFIDSLVQVQQWVNDTFRIAAI